MKEPITYRTPRSVWIVFIVLFAVILNFTVISFAMDLGLLYQLAFTVLSVLFLYSFLELYMRRVSLESDSLILVSECRRRIIRRDEVESVTWGKGAGVFVKLLDGTQVKLPEVEGSGLGLTNSVRAWIKRTPGRSR